MKIDKIWAISFSPTGNSRRVVDGIVSGLGLQGVPVGNINLTHPEVVPVREFTTHDLVVVGVPVYAGRVAQLSVKRLAAMAGNNTPAVLVVTYGNREFEDALIELKDLSENAGFRPVAACAFIGEHSFSNAETPIAAGRPDSRDLATAEKFGKSIRKKLAEIDDIETSECSPAVPGNRPYKEGMGQLPFTPTLLATQCTQCASCLAGCPTGAISLQEKIEIDPNLCIFCCSCIKICPEKALVIDAAPLKEKRQWLHEHCKEQKEPQLYQ